MKLKNNFTQKTRNLFLYQYQCWLCGRSDRGLELHHIFGRVSNSPFNASVLCMECHSHIGHTQEEHSCLLKLSSEFLMKQGYKTTEKDKEFLKTTNFINLWKNE